MRHPLPYAWAKAQQLLLEDDGERLVLWAAPETIYERVKNQSHRPLLQAPDPLAKIRELMTLRTPVYREAADIMVGVDYRHAPEVARHIAKSFQDAARIRPGSSHCPSPADKPQSSPQT